MHGAEEEARNGPKKKSWTQIINFTEFFEYFREIDVMSFDEFFFAMNLFIDKSKQTNKYIANF